MSEHVHGLHVGWCGIVLGHHDAPDGRDRGGRAHIMSFHDPAVRPKIKLQLPDLRGQRGTDVVRYEKHDDPPLLYRWKLDARRDVTITGP